VEPTRTIGGCASFYVCVCVCVCVCGLFKAERVCVLVCVCVSGATVYVCMYVTTHTRLHVGGWNRVAPIAHQQAKPTAAPLLHTHTQNMWVRQLFVIHTLNSYVCECVFVDTSHFGVCVR